MNSDYVLMGAAVAILGFLWQLHRDMASVKERLARIEGWIEGRFKESTAGD